MIESEEAIAGLFYFIHHGALEPPPFDKLPIEEQARWQRLTRFVLKREIDLTAKLAASKGYYSDHSKKLVDRIERWHKEQKQETPCPPL